MALSPTTRTVFLGCLLLTACGDDDDDDDSDDASTMNDGASPQMSFFVTSDTSMTGNLGGLSGADARCQRLAAAVGAGSKTWRAYLSVERDPANGNMPTHARDRIGRGPWYNAKGVLLANDLNALHALTGNADLFLDERGAKINGQWTGSPDPNEHDILTGSNTEGRVMAGETCADWTSGDPSPTVARVGHSDGLGPSQNAAAPYNSWNSSHATRGCNDFAPTGGSGRTYCFATN